MYLVYLEIGKCLWYHELSGANDRHQSLSVDINFLNIRTSKKFVVITLKFELCGSTIE